MRRSRSAIAWLLVLGACHAAHAETASSNDRFLVYLDGRHVGWAHWEHSGSGTAERYVEEQVIRVKERGGQGEMRQRLTVQALRSGGFSIERELHSGPTSTRNEARIEQGRVRVGAADAGPWPADAVLPQGLSASLQERARAPGASIAMLDTNRVLPAVARLAACPAAADLRCVRLVLDGRHEDWTFDARGRVASVERQFAGLPLVLRRCESDCDRPVVEPFDAVGHLVVASPYKIPESASQRELRFVLSRADGERPVLAQTGDQRVAHDGARAIVSVCRDCGEASVETPQTLAPYLRANAWIQSGDPIVRRLAARVGGRGQSVDERMRRSVVVLAERLKGYPGYIAYADAVQVLRLGHADCTGYAVALAALARAQGIPARVVVGMAYADRFSGRREVFSPHAWVQAWDGTRWRSYDAALLDFDSTHVALAVGDGHPGKLIEAFLQLSQLRIERLAAVKPE